MTRRRPATYQAIAWRWSGGDTPVIRTIGGRHDTPEAAHGDLDDRLRGVTALGWEMEVVRTWADGITDTYRVASSGIFIPFDRRLNAVDDPIAR